MLVDHDGTFDLWSYDRKTWLKIMFICIFKFLYASDKVYLE